MKVAVPIRNGRVSPVFDAAGRLAVFEFEGDSCSARSELDIRGAGIEARAALLKELGVSVLICGGISNRTARIVERGGIRLVPWIVGDIDEVIDAWCTGSLDGEGFMMPGCRRGRGRGHGRHGGGRRSRR
jgi:predicted Fe-Mo cluster-binding NifX family protein